MLAEGQAEVRSRMGAASGWNQVPSLEGSRPHRELPSLRALPSLPAALLCFHGIASGHRAASPVCIAQGHYRNAFGLFAL